jgi:hypothetical protein
MTERRRFLSKRYVRDVGRNPDARPPRLPPVRFELATRHRSASDRSILVETGMAALELQPEISGRSFKRVASSSRALWWRFARRGWDERLKEAGAHLRCTGGSADVQAVRL